MAVKDANIYHPVDNLILSRPRKHFRAEIAPIHWQLRSIVSCESSHIVYYPGGASKRKIIKLDIRTREFETLRVLQFSPRCLVSHNGWLCCGGETGEFVAIRLDDNNAAWPASIFDSPRASTSSGDPTSTSALAAATRTTEDALRSILRTLYAPSQIFGKDRVNCITMWFPPEHSPPKENAYDQPVAILANNDKNVIFSTLKEGDSATLDTVHYPDCVNRAVISPDGIVCAAICDDPYLYIHERVKKSHREPDYEWVQQRKIHLKSQRVDDRSDNRGSFALCFSNTGHYLAVGTQYGRISIFDATLLLDTNSEPLLHDFASSRPNTDVGAVREMAFCPGPFDLLAWTEDRGRVGVADIRRGYVSRQILRLDNKEDFEHFDIIDKQSIDPRLADSRDSLGERYESYLADSFARNAASSTIIPADGPVDAPATRQPAANRASDAEFRRLNAPLTREETMVLDAMREINRRRREGITASPLPDGPSNAGSSSTSGATRPSRDRSVSVTRSNTSTSNNTTANTATGNNPTGTDSRLVRDLLSDATSGNWREFAPSPAGGGSGTPGIPLSPSLEQTRPEGNYIDMLRRQGEEQRQQYRERNWTDTLRRVGGLPAATTTRRSARFGDSLYTSTSSILSGSSGTTTTGTTASGAGSGGDRNRTSTTATVATATGTAAGDTSPAATPANTAANATLGTLGTGTTATNSGAAAASRLGARAAWAAELGALPYLDSLGIEAAADLQQVAGSGASTSSGDPRRETRESRESRLADGDRDILFRPGLGQYMALREFEEARLVRTNDNAPDDTAGMSWGGDGRILYVGTTDGIYEFHVNVAGRKIYPSITMR